MYKERQIPVVWLCVTVWPGSADHTVRLRNSGFRVSSYHIWDGFQGARISEKGPKLVYKERQIPVVWFCVTGHGTLGRLYIWSYMEVPWRNARTYGKIDLLHSIFNI